MSATVTPRALLAAGFMLMVIGLERLLSAYLVGSQADTWSTRLLIGLFSLTGGIVLVVLVRSGGIRLER